MKQLYYKVGDHVFAVETDSNESVAERLRQYEPFVTERTEDVAFRLRLYSTPLNVDDFVLDLKQEDEGQEILSGHIGENPCFQFFFHQQLKGVLLCSGDYRQGELYAEPINLFGINNALMIMFALATAEKRTALFHSSVVSHQDSRKFRHSVPSEQSFCNWKC